MFYINSSNITKNDVFFSQDLITMNLNLFTKNISIFTHVPSIFIY